MIISESSLRSKVRSILLEVEVFPLAQLEEIIKANVSPDELESDQFIKSLETLRKGWGKGYSKFSNLIRNDIFNTQKYLSEILDIVDKILPIYNTLGPDLKEKIGKGEISSDNLKNYLEGSKDKVSQKARVRIEIRKGTDTEPKEIKTGSSYRDYDVIYRDDNWTVVYPKTLLGSISWSVGLGNGDEERYVGGVGKVDWCTSSYSNNRFDMYFGNYHLFYCIKNRGYNINDKFRRICLAFQKDEDGNVRLITDPKISGTVNADNNSTGMSTEEEVIGLLGGAIYKKIAMEAATLPITSIEDVYSKITLSIFQRDLENYSDDKNLLLKHVSYTVAYSKDKEALKLAVSVYGGEPSRLENDLYEYLDGPTIFMSLISRKDIKEYFSQEEILNIFNSIDNNNMNFETLGRCENLTSVFSADGLIQVFKSGKFDPTNLSSYTLENFFRNITYNRDKDFDFAKFLLFLLKNKIPGAFSLVFDEKYSAIDALTQEVYDKGKNAREIEEFLYNSLSGSLSFNAEEFFKLFKKEDEKAYLFKDLVEDFDFDIKRYRVKLLKHPLVIDLLEGKGRKLLKGILLSKSGAYTIEEKCAIVERDDLNLVDPRGSYLYRTLSKHPNFQIRLSLAGRDDLLVVDPSGEVINNLKNDEKSAVRNALEYNPMHYLKESTSFLIDLLRG